MGHFFRLIDNSVIDLFVQKAEDSRYCRDQLLKDTPYLLRHRELDCFPGYFPEKTSDGLVVAEPSGKGKHVVLNAAQGSGCNLGCETGALALPEAEIGLAVLEHDFKSPSARIYLPCLEEIKSDVSGEKTVPFAMPGAAYKEYPDRHSAEKGIVYDIAALEFAAVLPQFEFPAQFHERRSGEVSVFGMIFCPAVLADLYHAEPVAFGMAAVDGPYNILIGEPAVSQYITEFYAFLYGSLYHLFGKLDLGHAVCLLAIAEHLAVVLGPVTADKLLGAHAVIPFLPFFSDDVEVKKNLGHAVGHSHAETFESQHGLMGKVGVDPSDPLDCPACLFVVGVVENETHVFCPMVCTDVDAVPELNGDMPQSLSPVYIGIVHEAVEDIFPGLDQWIEHAVLLIAEGVPYAETGKKKKALEDSQQPADAVAFAAYAECIPFGHPDLGEYRTYVLHGGCHIGILEKSFDIREKWCNFVCRHGFELVFWWYLKLLIFL